MFRVRAHPVVQLLSLHYSFSSPPTAADDEEVPGTPPGTPVLAMRPMRSPPFLEPVGQGPSFQGAQGPPNVEGLSPELFNTVL